MAIANHLIDPARLAEAKAAASATTDFVSTNDVLLSRFGRAASVDARVWRESVGE